jgi:hypothetical protein
VIKEKNRSSFFPLWNNQEVPNWETWGFFISRIGDNLDEVLKFVVPSKFTS